MIPTLNPEDTILVNVAAYRFHPPHDGDVAVFMPPVTSHGVPFVKRVIGVPGDTVRISDGTLYRDGSVVREPYLNEATQYDLALAHHTIVVDGRPLDPRSADIPPARQWQAPNRVPAGFYLVLGDNRNYSDDSHLWGFARLHAFVGRAVMVLWPPSHIRMLN